MRNAVHCAHTAAEAEADIALYFPDGWEQLDRLKAMADRVRDPCMSTLHPHHGMCHLFKRTTSATAVKLQQVLVATGVNMC